MATKRTTRPEWKVALTALSLASTVGGWALLARGAAPPAEGEAGGGAAPWASGGGAPEVRTSPVLPPVPTAVPLPGEGEWEEWEGDTPLTPTLREAPVRPWPWGFPFRPRTRSSR